MPGFLISNLNTFKYPYVNEEVVSCKDSVCIDEYTVNRNVLSQFLNDKIMADLSDFFIILDGVILNKKELLNGRDDSEWENYVVECIRQGKKYYDYLRGSFCGAHYDKKLKTWTIFTDFMSTKPLFYYAKDDVFVVSEDLSLITHILTDNGIAFSIDKNAVYDMLSYGYMIGERTYIEEIRKIPYGCCVSYSNGVLEINRYYDFDYNDDDLNYTDVELVNQLDDLFNKAIDLEFEKDKEYGYSHLVTLSGGCDSRMDTWVAKKRGYDDVVNICICESDMLDEKCAKMVSNALGTELIVKSLNGGGFLNNYREIANMGFGLVNYCGISHMISAIKLFDKGKFGLFHTGELGDVVIGAYYNNKTADPDFVIADSEYKSKVTDKFDESIECPEKFLMKNRGFNGCIGTWLVQNNYFETISPFLYRELFEFCVSKIPFEKRNNRRIYDLWIKEKWPDAGNIPFERFFGGTIYDSKIKRKILMFKYYGFLKGMDWALRKMKLRKRRLRFDKGMNPLDKWYGENAKLRHNLDSYCTKIIRCLRENQLIDTELEKDIESLYSNGMAKNKMSVITVLSALELLFL